MVVLVLLTSVSICLSQEGLELGVQERLVADICSLKRTLDTKETNFFFSVLLTGGVLPI